VVCYLLFGFRDVQTDSSLSSTQFDSAVKLFGSTPISSSTRQPVSPTETSKLSLDIISHLPSMRATYLAIDPVSTLTQLPSRYAVTDNLKLLCVFTKNMLKLKKYCNICSVGFSW